MLFLDWDSASPHIIAHLAPYDPAQKLPSIRLPDTQIAIVFDLIKPMCPMGIPIRQAHLDFWDIDLRTIAEAAEINTPKLRPATVTKTDDILVSNRGCGLTYDGDPDGHVPVWTVSTPIIYHGAICILYSGMYDYVRQVIGEDFYIVFTSQHESLCIPASTCPTSVLYAALQTMAHFTDRFGRDVLSDGEVYRFDNGGLVVAPWDDRTNKNADK